MPFHTNLGDRMFVKDLMTKEIVSIEYDKTVLDACNKYKECGLGSLVVVNSGIVVGIITERDIIERVIVNKKNPKKTKIEEIMSKNIITIHASAKIEQAAKLMKKHKIKKLPVILNNSFVGIITVTDLANIMPKITKILADENQPFNFITPESY
jgi:CBS domain-containing protein